MTPHLHLVPLVNPDEGEQTDVRGGTRMCRWCDRDRQYRSEYCSADHAARAARARHLGSIAQLAALERNAGDLSPALDDARTRGVVVRPAPGPDEETELERAARVARSMRLFQMSVIAWCAVLALFVGFCAGVQV
jgi:hypothetical protein